MTLITILIDCILCIVWITYLSKYVKWPWILIILFGLFVLAIVLDPLLAPHMVNLKYIGTASTYFESLVINGIWFVVSIAYLVVYNILLKKRRCEMKHESQTISVSV